MLSCLVNSYAYFVSKPCSFVYAKGLRPDYEIPERGLQEIPVEFEVFVKLDLLYGVHFQLPKLSDAELYNPGNSPMMRQVQNMFPFFDGSVESKIGIVKNP